MFQSGNSAPAGVEYPLEPTPCRMVADTAPTPEDYAKHISIIPAGSAAQRLRIAA